MEVWQLGAENGAVPTADTTHHPQCSGANEKVQEIRKCPMVVVAKSHLQGGHEVVVVKIRVLVHEANLHLQLLRERPTPVLVLVPKVVHPLLLDSDDDFAFDLFFFFYLDRWQHFNILFKGAMNF